MPNLQYKFLCLLLGGLCIHVKSDQDSDWSTEATSYRAAVYEHVAVSQTNPTETVTRSEALGIMRDNLRVYEQQAKIASKQNVSIIIFPESGLYGVGHTRASIFPYLEEVTDAGLAKNIPCDDVLFPPVQRYLSCIAKNNSMYVVANMGDIRICDKATNPACPADNRFQFSTNIVYDDKGKQVACYHKRHLFNESRFDPAPLAEHSTFKTHFGKFATLIHNDIFFNDTMVYLWWNYKINTIAITAAARNDFPYTVPIVAHRGLSMLFLYNVLSAGLRNSQYEYGGSGLFMENCGVYHLDLNNTYGKLLITDLPVEANKSKPCGPYSQHDDSYYQSNDMIRQKIKWHRGERNTLKQKPISSNVDLKLPYSKFSHSFKNHDRKNINKQASINVKSTNGQKNPSKSMPNLNPYKRDWIPASIINFQNVVKGDLFTMVPLIEDEDFLQVCQGGTEHCCTINYNFRSNPDQELYALGAYIGNHTQGAAMFVRVCVLLKCRTKDLSSCGEDVRSATTTFDYISLWSGADTIFMLPYVVTSPPEGGVKLGMEEFTYLPANFSSIKGFKDPLLSLTLFETYYDPY